MFLVAKSLKRARRISQQNFAKEKRLINRKNRREVRKSLRLALLRDEEWLFYPSKKLTDWIV